MQVGSRYVLISPVKNEEKHVARTLDSVVAQSKTPVKWIIVDDNSEDRTPEILQDYARRVDWITILRLRQTGVRQPGSALIRAFNQGYELLHNIDFDFLVKLDCDLELPPTYFERLMAMFHSDGRLGIASGVYLEDRQGRWSPVKMPPYHAAGASKMMRRSCFDEIGGFVASRGWDTVDEIKAQMSGWKTAHFEDLEFLHLKPEGSGIGVLRTSVMHGEIFYLTGGGAVFFLLKFLDRLVHAKPLVLASLAMLWGYLKQWMMRAPRLVTQSEAGFYRQMLNGRIRNSLGVFARKSEGKRLAQGAR